MRSFTRKSKLSPRSHAHGATSQTETRFPLQATSVPGGTQTMMPGHTQPISALRGAGQMLDSPTRVFMESRFGHDFGNVRVHADSTAADLSRLFDARALAVGQTLVFGAGQYAPETAAGKRLIAHELAHVVQARTRPANGLNQISKPSDMAEQEARDAATAVGMGRSFQIRQAPSAILHRAEPTTDAAPKAKEKWWDFEPDDLKIVAQKPENAKQAQKLRKLIWVMARPNRAEIERNTAQRIFEGSISVRLVDDLDVYPDQESWLRQQFPSEDPQQKLANGRVLVHPRLGPSYIPNKATAFEAPEDPVPEIFMRGTDDARLMVTPLIHEVNHKVNRPESQRFTDPAMQQAWDRFVSETRAYYVADFRHETGSMQDNPQFHMDATYLLADYHDPPTGERRLAVSKLMVLLSYPHVKHYFDTDPAFKQACRSWQLSGNLENAPLTP